MPVNVQNAIDEFEEKNGCNMNYYILNYNAKDFKQNFLIDKNMPNVRINFVPHPYLF